VQSNHPHQRIPSYARDGCRTRRVPSTSFHATSEGHLSSQYTASLCPTHAVRSRHYSRRGLFPFCATHPPFIPSLSPILDVTALSPPTTLPPIIRRPSVVNLRLPGPSVPDKVVHRPDVSIPIGPPLPTWSELSTLSIHLYASTTAAASGLDLMLGAKKSGGSGSATPRGQQTVFGSNLVRRLAQQ
jgi:hypothetical protein